MNSRKVHVAVCLILAGLTAVCLGRVVGNDFINLDDPGYVTNVPEVQEGLNWESLEWAWTNNNVGLWIPLTWMSLQLDAMLYWPYPNMGPTAASGAAWGFHLTNLLLHVVNVLLVYRLLLRLNLRTGTAAFAAALFAVHPLRVESVAWITERKDVLSGCFGLLALLAFLRFRDSPAAGRFLFVALLMALSLLAKPVLVILPALMLLCFASGLAVGEKRASVKPLAGAGLLVSLSLLDAWITFAKQTETHAVANLPLGIRLGNAVVSCERYLTKTFWPVDLAVFYPHSLDTLTWLQIGRACFILSAITLLAVALRRKLPAVLAGWLWFLIALLPNIGLIQAGTQGMADRFTYFASIGLFLALAAGGEALMRRFRVPRFVVSFAAALVIAGLGMLTWNQVGLWKNCETLYRHTLEVTHDNAYVHALLGQYLYENHDVDGAGREFERSMAIQRRVGFSIPTTPRSPKEGEPESSGVFHLYYGFVLYDQGRWQEAAQQLEQGMTLGPELSRAQQAGVYFRFGESLQKLGRLPKARQYIAAAIALDPGVAARVHPPK